jgi:hypothetical protein
MNWLRSLQALGYKTEDVTSEAKTSTEALLNRHAKLLQKAQETPKTIYYFRQNTQNKLFFYDFPNTTHYLLQKDNFLALQIQDEKFTPEQEKIVHKFLRSQIQCRGCSKYDYGFLCDECGAFICKSCTKSEKRKTDLCSHLSFSSE